MWSRCSTRNLAATSRHALRPWCAAVVCGEDVARKKPDPQAYLQALHALRLEAADTLAIEDAPAGVAAASAAGVPVAVTRSRYFAAGASSEAVAVGPSLGAGAGWQPAAAADARIDDRATQGAR